MSKIIYWIADLFHLCGYRLDQCAHWLYIRKLPHCSKCKNGLSEEGYTLCGWCLSDLSSDPVNNVTQAINRLRKLRDEHIERSDLIDKEFLAHRRQAKKIPPNSAVKRNSDDLTLIG